MSDSRLEFEEFITSSPFEKCIDRFPDSHKSSWPGSYKDLSVELAWETWQASRQLLNSAEIACISTLDDD